MEDNKKYFAVHWKDKITGEKGFNIVAAENVNEAHCNIFGYGSRFEWIGSEPLHNVL